MSTVDPIDEVEAEAFLSRKDTARYASKIPSVFALLGLGVFSYLYWTHFLSHFHSSGHPIADGVILGIMFVIFAVIFVIYTVAILYALTLVRLRRWKTKLSASLAGMLALGVGLIGGTLFVGGIYLLID